MDRAYCDARELGWSREPIIELVIPSTLDDTLAPRGAHVASLFCQHVAPELPDGRSWNDHRERVADLMIETVDRYAPGFKASVVGRQALSPFDLEQVFGLTGGDIFHGALSLDQLFSARPALGYADYRGPLKGLYHCGSGAHPGGGVTGAPGHNAARAIIADRRGGSASRQSSATKPEAFTTGAQRAMSALTVAAKSAGLWNAVVLPTLARFSIIARGLDRVGDGRAQRIDDLGGRLRRHEYAEPQLHHHVVTASRMVGTSGRNDERCDPVTASMRIVPALACVMLSLIGLTPAGTWPPIRSCKAGAPPR